MNAPTILLGDCVERLKELDANSIDACVTDPPYGLEFMGKDWDRLGKPDGFRRARNTADAGRDNVFGRTTRTSPEYAQNAAMQAWHEEWAREVLRVLKPGAHLLAFGGSRTHHRLACAIEDAGFEIRDVLMWLYGTGFPKSLNAAAAIAKHFDPNWETGKPMPEAALRWSGFGTALKPAYEPVILARKPLAGTVAKNVLEHGTGALNIDACRIRYASEDDKSGATPQEAVTSKKLAGDGGLGAGSGREGPRGEFERSGLKGRWPANVILDEEAAAMLDEQSGVLRAGVAKEPKGKQMSRSIYGKTNTLGRECGYADGGGGASRFFYCAKASKAERGEGNNHPTVKPLALMKYLVKLVTPPGGTVLDPFVGSGTTGVACKVLGFDFCGIEKDESYMKIATQRIKAARRREQ